MVKIELFFCEDVVGISDVSAVVAALLTKSSKGIL